MWEAWCLTTPWASTACYRESFTFFTLRRSQLGHYQRRMAWWLMVTNWKGFERSSWSNRGTIAEYTWRDRGKPCKRVRIPGLRSIIALNISQIRVLPLSNFVPNADESNCSSALKKEVPNSSEKLVKLYYSTLCRISGESNLQVF
jgi:hypothetical protein